MWVQSSAMIQQHHLDLNPRPQIDKKSYATMCLTKQKILKYSNFSHIVDGLVLVEAWRTLVAGDKQLIWPRGKST